MPSSKRPAIAGQEMSPQQLIRSLPKFYDPKSDPAMIPKKVSGSKIAPLSSLSARQRKILEFAKERARQPRKSISKAKPGGQKNPQKTNVSQTLEAKTNSTEKPTGEVSGEEVLDKQITDKGINQEAKQDQEETDDESDDEYMAGL